MGKQALSTDYKKIEKDILRSIGTTKNSAYVARYVGAVAHEKRQKDEMSELVFLGASLILQRQIAKKYLVYLKIFSPEEIWNIFSNLFKKSKYFDVRNIALVILSDKSLKTWRLQNHKKMFELADYVDNWALSDTLSTLYAEILENDPKLIHIYKKWNQSQNPWLRRQSLVGIYCYARFRKKPIPVKTALSLVKVLLDDPHYYVQKGVGWTLREIDRIDTGVQRNFIKENLASISSVAWFATSELYDLKLKKHLVHVRKKLRQKRE